MQSRLILPCLAVIAILGGIAPAAAGPFTDIVAFGDSLSDAGNVFLATGGTIPGAPYANGHFSNGPTWVENLSQNLGLGTLLPALAGGTDFAFGFAVTGPAVPVVIPIFPNITVPNITQQVALFLATTSGIAPSTDLYTLWIGSNDVFQAVADIAASALTFAAAQTDLAAAAQTAATAVHTLAGAGATTFIVPLVPDLGKTPAVAAVPALVLAATQLSAYYNAVLVSDIALVASDNIAVHFLDTFSMLDAAIQNSAAFGFTNITDPCYTGPYTGGGSACSTPDSYLFWDNVHPTESYHQQLAALAESELSVPEPPVLPIFLAAGLILVVWRRFRRAEYCTPRQTVAARGEG